MSVKAYHEQLVHFKFAFPWSTEAEFLVPRHPLKAQIARERSAKHFYQGTVTLLQCPNGTRCLIMRSKMYTFSTITWSGGLQAINEDQVPRLHGVLRVMCCLWGFIRKV